MITRPEARIAVRWRPREPPLAPVAAVALDAAAVALAVRLLRLPDDHLAALRGVTAGTSLAGTRPFGPPRHPSEGQIEARLALRGSASLVVLGESDALPWVDGAIYLGRDPSAPALLLPAVLEPDVAPALLERALLARARYADRPLAVVPDRSLVIGAGASRPIARSVLAAWLEAR